MAVPVLAFEADSAVVWPNASKLMMSPVGNSHYDALQTRLDRRFRDFYQLNVNYTWSKSITTSGVSDSDNGLRININIGIQYLGAWLAGTGCVPIFNIMEDAATAEISRAQIWHWIRSPLGVLDDGRKVTRELFQQLVPEELDKVRQILGGQQYSAGKYPEAAAMFEQLTLDEICARHVTSDVHFLKIDVEGAEAEVISGFAFSTVRPWILVVEATLPNSAE